MKLIHCDMGHMKVATWFFYSTIIVLFVWGYCTDTVILAEVYKTYLKKHKLKNLKTWVYNFLNKGSLESEYR